MMEKLYKYLQSIGIEERPKRGVYNDPPAVFYRELYGDSSYFFNAPNHTHPGAVIVLDYNADAPAEYFKSLQEKERRIATYCRKYGYICRRNTCHYSKTVYFYLESAEDHERANSFYSFRDACRDEVEKTAHALYQAGKPEEVEPATRQIMTEYGNAYNEFLEATA